MRSKILNAALIITHAEMVAPEKYMAKYRGKFLPEKSFQGVDDGPKFRKGSYASQPECHAALAAMVNVIDDYVGDIMNELDQLGLKDNTLVIFSSDNGPHLEGGNDPGYLDSNGEFRGFKRDLYDGGIHVPFIAAWPGKIPAGTVSDHLSAFWDFLPTMVDLTGQPASAHTDGISMLPTLLNKPGQKQHDHLYWGFKFNGQRKAVLQDPWKAVQYGNNPTKLFNLKDDPGETKDLAAQYPEILKPLESIMKTARQ